MILIRDRIAISVYGTNTQLEQVEIGARRACPQEYTVTAASHDPDGRAHDWLGEALLFSVVDSRYTAGAANLPAEVRVRLAPNVGPRIEDYRTGTRTAVPFTHAAPSWTVACPASVLSGTPEVHAVRISGPGAGPGDPRDP